MAMLHRTDRKKVRAMRKKLRRDGGLNSADRRQVRSLRQHLQARSHDRRSRALDPEQRWKGGGPDVQTEAPAEEPGPRVPSRGQRPWGGRRPLRPMPGPLGPGSRLRRRPAEREGEDDDVEVVTEEPESQEVVDTLTGMLGEIAGLTSFSGEAPGLGAVVKGLRRQGYRASDIVGALQDFGHELLDQVARTGVELGATVGEAREAAGPVMKAVQALGRGVKRVAQGAGKGARKVASRVKARRQARREGLRAEREATRAEQAMVINNTDVSPRSLLRGWSDFVAPPEMGMRFQVAAGKAVYVQPVDANRSIFVVTTAPNDMGAMTEAVARAAGQSLLTMSQMSTWKSALDPLAAPRRLSGPVDLGCAGRRCPECEQGL